MKSKMGTIAAMQACFRACGCRRSAACASRPNVHTAAGPTQGGAPFGEDAAGVSGERQVPSGSIGTIAVEPSDQVDYISGRTRLFAIVGHPIAQVRSPEMITAELRARGHDAILVPLHVLPEDFDACLPQLMRVRNLGGLVFTIPYKLRACALADELGAQARVVGAINALANGDDGRWRGDIFDGLGCVEAFRRRGLAFSGKRVMLLGAGGAGSAIAAAIAFERPASLRIFDIDGERARLLAETVARANPRVAIAAASPTTRDVDILVNASPVGMLDDARLPLPITPFAARACRVRCNRQAGTHATHHAGRAVRLHHRVWPRDDARPDRSDGGLLLRCLNAACVPPFRRPRKSVPTEKSESLLQHLRAPGAKVMERDNESRWMNRGFVTRADTDRIAASQGSTTPIRP